MSPVELIARFSDAIAGAPGLAILIGLVAGLLSTAT